LAILAAAVCLLGLFSTLLGATRLVKPIWFARVVSALSVLVVIVGALLTFAASALGTPVDGVITFFFVLGLAGYLSTIASILSPYPASNRLRDIGPLVLLLASWSWISALGMHHHRGALGDTSEACILVPKPARYNTELTSIWEMRFPEVATSRTGPTGTTILDYHAILVAPSDQETRVYNWSKRWMRFDVLDKKRNPYLPMACP